MATPQEIIKAMVASLHQNHFKELGFRKSGTTWVRSLPWPQVINIQLSRWNTSTEASFTVNLGIFIETLHTASEGLPIKGSLKEADCDLRERIGQLSPTAQDKWWKVTPDSDLSLLTEDVFANLKQFGLPWLERLTDYPALAVEFTKAKRPFMASLAYHFAGDSIAAEKAMSDAFANSHPLGKPKLERVALAVGIPIKER